MSQKYDIMERRHVLPNCAEEVALVIKRGENIALRKSHEYEKKVKRQIANSNERRRMKSINMGFEMLKQLLPSSIDGEKLSKASILQLTAQYIENLHSRITSLENNMDHSNNEPKESAGNCESTSEAVGKSIPVNKSTNQFMKHQISHSGDLNICRKRRLLTREKISPDSSLESTGLTKSLEDENDVKLLYCDELSDETSEAPGSLEHLVAAIKQVEGEQFCHDRKVKCQIINSTKSQLSNSSAIIQIDKSLLTKTMSITDSKLTQSATPNSSKLDSSTPSLVQKPVKYLLKPSHINTNQCTVSASSVIKPTISPYTETILYDFSQNPHLFKTAKFVNTQDSSTVRKISIPPKYQHRPDVVLQKNSGDS